MPANSEHDALIGSYEHLTSMPRAADALHAIRKIASLVKPIMRKRNWHVRILSEFYPGQENLLGINVNRGHKICLRLRYPGDKDQFLPTEQVIDTMLHELSHNVFGPHDEKFHALWDELRDEYTELTIKGFTGEGFLSDGQRLGGRNIPIQEMRRQARVAAQQRKIRSQGSGQKLGGAPIMYGVDMRQVIADAASRRMSITTGCASNHDNAEELGDEASANGFKTKAEENDANDRAIAQALWELVQEEEARKAGARDWRDQGLVWNPSAGMKHAEAPKEIHPGDPPVKPKKMSEIAKAQSSFLEKLPKPAQTSSRTPSAAPKTKRVKTEHRSSAVPIDLTEDSPPSLPPPPTTWSCGLCTLVNPIELATCNACLDPRPAEITALLKSKSKSVSKSASPNPKEKANTSKLLKLSNKSTSLISAAEAEARARLKPKAGWTCTRCGNWMESLFWSCHQCGNIKEKS